MSTIHHRVTIAARHAGLRIADLARHLGVKPPTVHGGLATNRPTFKHLPRIAALCQVSCEWLRTGDPALEPAWWIAYGAAHPADVAGAGAPAGAGMIADDGSPMHLVTRVRMLEQEKAEALRERDEARARVAALEQEVADLAETVTHQAVRLAKIHKNSEPAAASVTA